MPRRRITQPSRSVLTPTCWTGRRPGETCYSGCSAPSIGIAAVQALLAYLTRHDYDVILTDGEHIGIPLALLLKLTRSRTLHVTIGHRLSAAKKRPFFR